VADQINMSIGPTERLPESRYAIRAFVALVLAGLLAFEFLNLSGFCYAQHRYLSVRELVDAAAGYNLAKHDPAGERDLAYASPDELYSKNPNCCGISNVANFQESPVIFRLFGRYETPVHIHYRITNRPDEYQFYGSDVVVNACGKVVASSGTLEKQPPQK